VGRIAGLDSLPTWLFRSPDGGGVHEQRIPNGAWCLFRAAPGGTRNGKIVVVQYRSIDDPETGGSYTIKRYLSEKVTESDGTWRHTRIELSQETNNPDFKPILLNVLQDDDLTVVAEMLIVL
jgi:uncharacterized protein